MLSAINQKRFGPDRSSVRVEIYTFRSGAPTAYSESRFIH